MTDQTKQVKTDHKDDDKQKKGEAFANRLMEIKKDFENQVFDGVDVSDAQFYRFFDISPGKFAGWKRGDVVAPKQKDAEKIADKLGLEPQWVMYGKGEKYRQKEKTKNIIQQDEAKSQDNYYKKYSEMADTRDFPVIQAHPGQRFDDSRDDVHWKLIELLNKRDDVSQSLTDLIRAVFELTFKKTIIDSAPKLRNQELMTLVTCLDKNQRDSLKKFLTDVER
ncbi:MAG: hypothetical protein ACOC2M_02655 [bacterium]